MHDIYTNSNNPKQNRFSFAFHHLAKNREIRISVPFFSKTDVLKEAVKNGCEIFLIIKLGDGTPPKSILEIINLQNIHIRYLTDKFHSKLYLFGNDCAFVGSSNLTENGLWNNSEINILVPSEDPKFEVLRGIFEKYWSSAKPLTKIDLRKYEKVYEDNHVEKGKSKFKSDLEAAFGTIVVERNNLKTENKQDDYLKHFLQQYQIFLKKFDELRNIYEEIGMRRFKNEKLPLRIEIDQFLSWVKERKIKNISHLRNLNRGSKDFKEILTKNIKEFLHDDFNHAEKVAEEIYPFFRENLANEDRVKKMSSGKFFELFSKINAFSSSYLRYNGGKEESKVKFLKENSERQLKITLNYLFFGKDSYEKRIANCKFDKQYRLNGFGESTIKELYGWGNNEEVPIYNERVAKAMEWLGFGQL